MIIEHNVIEHDHKVVYSIGPSSPEEMNQWHDEMYAVWKNEYAKIINSLRVAYQYDALLLYS